MYRGGTCSLTTTPPRRIRVSCSQKGRHMQIPIRADSPEEGLLLTIGRNDVAGKDPLPFGSLPGWPRSVASAAVQTLLDADLIEIVPPTRGPNKKRGRGRPTQRYRLTTSGRSLYQSVIDAHTALQKATAPAPVLSEQGSEA